ncbi:hypothetical protein PSCICO_37990 [Pseudomonas cichorii]|uniref:Phage protein n=1 Tax=Pseudomonas serbiensis TaxID=3064350 RepID=A0ABT9CJ86_9PSED|nr:MULTISPECIES: hypothetical protein [Pseudomonas]MDO7925544.1 hypothetical protein [Pseudomonas sp. KFB-138]GFM77537.1 hypothetical protein PSCICM_33560 [Pseudomonas cichorii]GFM81204.1 hypothetical protein PSCICN_18960 [Pseudomonas cichorii]GFM88400.1 hypothetical protein PSCICO_37990 [Pseudomonas cichorii]
MNYTHNDLVTIAQETGRSVEEIEEIAKNSGWQLSEKPKTLRSLDNSKDAVAMMKQIKEQTLQRLYRDDPFIREGINAQAAIEAARQTRKNTEPNNNIYDENGHFQGVNKSIISGPAATGKNQADAMKAIKANIYKRLGAEQ